MGDCSAGDGKSSPVNMVASAEIRSLFPMAATATSGDFSVSTATAGSGGGNGGDCDDDDGSSFGDDDSLPLEDGSDGGGLSGLGTMSTRAFDGPGGGSAATAAAPLSPNGSDGYGEESFEEDQSRSSGDDEKGSSGGIGGDDSAAAMAHELERARALRLKMGGGEAGGVSKAAASPVGPPNRADEGSDDDESIADDVESIDFDEESSFDKSSQEGAAEYSLGGDGGCDGGGGIDLSDDDDAGVNDFLKSVGRKPVAEPGAAAASAAEGGSPSIPKTFENQIASAHAAIRGKASGPSPVLQRRLKEDGFDDGGAAVFESEGASNVAYEMDL